MKILFALGYLVFCISQISFAQNLPVDTTTKKITYHDTSVFIIKQAEAYKKVKDWCENTKNFKIEFSDPALKKLTARGSTSVYYKKEGGVANTGFVINKNDQITSKSTTQGAAGNISYKLEFTFSVSKVICKVTDLVHHGTGEIGDGGPLEKYPECGSEKIGTIPNWEYYKQQVNTDILKTLQEFKTLMTE